MLPTHFREKDPQRVCKACWYQLEPMQDQLVGSNANAHRDNAIEEDSMMRYFNSPTRFTLGGEVRKAAYTMQNCIDGFETALEDNQLTEDLFKGAVGVIFITVAKVAFIGGARFGTGLVVSRLPEGNGKTWSAPCALSLMGLTCGAQVGAEVTDMIIPLHDQTAMEHFNVPGGSHLLVGGEAGLAFGPIGRSGEASVMASTRSVDTAVSYSHSRGVFGGMSVEGAYVSVRDDVNRRFYGRDVDPKQLLDGTMPAPNAAGPLYHKLQEYEALYGIAHGFFYQDDSCDWD